MTRYERLVNSLEETGTGVMKVFGQSMTPILKSGVVLTYEKRETYEADDIVFSRVKGRFVDAHKITKKDEKKGYMIENNHGLQNGWTKTIYGKVIRAEYGDDVKEFD